MIAVRSSLLLNLLFAVAILLTWPAADAFLSSNAYGCNSIDKSSHSPTSVSSTSTTALDAIKAGDKLPWVDVHWGFNPPTILALPEYVARRNVIIVGVPGAFTSNAQVSTYLANSNQLKQLGVDEVIVTAVNDGAVMGVWQHKVNTAGTIVTFFADPHGHLRDECGTAANNVDWERRLGLLGRSKPFVMYVEGCVVKYFAVADSDEDGTTHAEAMMGIIERIRSEEMQFAQ
mmetsp:Transcript_34117/g.73956  ORF Transcript_34117/g.73956 Transcript_34117/m.73956 type:complete len:231 (-) Transcript_34117:1694-2386(-)